MKSTILIFYANSKGQEFLNELDKECKGIQRLLNVVERRQYEVSLIPQTNVSDVVNELNIPGREVEIIHYSGHANDSKLIFGDNAADAESLADKLRSLKTVKLVFINGCSSIGQVQFFHKAGIPYVIATSRPVEDVKASWVASQFYNYLSLGRTVNVAFEEIQKDGRLLKMDIDLVVNRSLGIENSSEGDDRFAWGLYVLPDSPEYRLPMSASVGQIQRDKVVHTMFLQKLLLALKNQNSPISSKYKNTITLTETQGAPPDPTIISNLLEILPYPLGIRLRQINGKPDEHNNLDEYYRELLHDYALFFETQLHLSAILLLSQLWQNKEIVDPILIDKFKPIRSFVTDNRLNHSLVDYSTVIQNAIEILKKSEIPNIVPKIENVKDYLVSQAFIDACTFFNLSKNYYWNNVRLDQQEAVDRCYASQDHITRGFQYFSFVIENVLASVRNVDTINFRHVDNYFSSSVAQLVVAYEKSGGDSMLDPKPMENKSILCYSQSDYRPNTQSINLFPFLIDRNVFVKQLSTEIDLYLLLGFFKDEMVTNLSIRKISNPCYYFMSLQNPQKIWCFNDEDPSASDLAHINEPVNDSYRQTHLLTNAGELKSYLSKFKTFFIAS